MCETVQSHGVAWCPVSVTRYVNSRTQSMPNFIADN